ncbi:amino acid transporter [Microbacterium deminutum]|uniref:Amino acid transporter n=1 Tax=Microbacterium deminutum TaxID=344164 RepID=A0ABN2QNK8_9MICO
MSDHRPTRRDLMKPVQLLGLAFGAALFAGVVTLVSMGFFQNQTAQGRQGDLVVALIIAGISFIAVLVIVALLLLVVDPAQITKTIDRGVLQDDEGDETDAAASDDGPKP